MSEIFLIFAGNIRAMKFNKDRDWLIDEYIVKGRKVKDIARDCGMKVGGLKCLLTRLNIRKPEFPLTKECLHREVYENRLSSEQIAEKYSIGLTSVYRHLKKYGYSIQAAPKLYSSYDSTKDELICSLYLEDKISAVEIAKIAGMSIKGVYNHLYKNGIKPRSLSEAQWLYRGKEIPEELFNRDSLYELYITRRLSKKDIAEQYNCDPCVIDRLLKSFGIPVRNNSEAKIGLYIGDKHPNWKGGLATLSARLRQYTMDHLSPIAARRDNYTCQLCGKTHTILHVHHIKHFSEILARILAEHPDLDPIKNVNELFEIGIKDKELNDIDNLITYCKDCHLHKIHKYGNLLADDKPIELLESPMKENQQPSTLSEGSKTIEKQ